MTDSNPKTAYGNAKPDLGLVPPAAIVATAVAFQDGAVKYGPYNWRKNDVPASVYISAALRHLLAWADGEETAADSGAHHLGHAMACMAILVDAQATKCLIDDRHKSRMVAALLAQNTKEMDK